MVGLMLVACAWFGCEAIAGLGDFKPEPETSGGAGGTGGGAGGAGGGLVQPRAAFSCSFGSDGRTS